MEYRQTSLTAYEVNGLSALCNLADGHAKLLPMVGGINLADIADIAIQRQDELEKKFLSAFGLIASQRYVRDAAVMFPSASAAIDSVAKYLASEGRVTAALLEPTFDNLLLLLRRAGVLTSAVGEDMSKIIEACNTNDTIFLVLPNNPTGWVPDRGIWTKLVQRLKETDTLLVVDRTFRFFAANDSALDHAVQSSPNIITIDDTGKTWSTLECKVATVTTGSSERLYAIREISEEVTLNVSPMSLFLCMRAMKLEGGRDRIVETVSVNANVLSPSLRIYGFVDVVSVLSFLVAQIPDEVESSSVEVVSSLLDHGVAALPLGRFFWASPLRGERFVRFSLARPTSLIKQAATTLIDASRRGGGLV